MEAKSLDETGVMPGDAITQKSMSLQIVGRLSEVYQEQVVGKSVDAFKAEHFRPMYEDKSINANKMANDFFEIPPSEKSNPYIDLMRLSCAYCVEAIRAVESTENDKAWIYVSYAHYWLGVVVGARMISGTAELALSQRAKAGAAARDKRYDVLRELARKLAAEGNFQSKRSAALGIKEEIVKRSNDKDLDIKLKPDQAERTITKWLDGMSFARMRSTPTS